MNTSLRFKDVLLCRFFCIRESIFDFSATAIEEDITLYAKWVKNYEVTYYLGDETDVPMYKQYVQEGQLLLLLLAAQLRQTLAHGGADVAGAAALVADGLVIQKPFREIGGDQLPTLQLQVQILLPGESWLTQSR